MQFIRNENLPTMYRYHRNVSPYFFKNINRYIFKEIIA